MFAVILRGQPTSCDLQFMRYENLGKITPLKQFFDQNGTSGSLRYIHYLKSLQKHDVCGHFEGSTNLVRPAVLEIWNFGTFVQFPVTPRPLRGQRIFRPTVARRHCSFRHSIRSNESHAKNRTVCFFAHFLTFSRGCTCRSTKNSNLKLPYKKIEHYLRVKMTSIPLGDSFIRFYGQFSVGNTISPQF